MYLDALKVISYQSDLNGRKNQTSTRMFLLRYLASSDPKLGDCFCAGGLTRGPTSIVRHHQEHCLTAVTTLNRAWLIRVKPRKPSRWGVTVKPTEKSHVDVDEC